MESALYRGWVRHRRRRPVEHAFRARLFMLYLDLDELPRVFDGRWLWSVESPNWASFRRSDHLGDPTRPLAETVRDLVEERTGRRPAGPVRLLTHLRYLGYAFNPVSLHYCFAADGRRLEAIVADVSNTPWNERHAYVLPVTPGAEGAGGSLRFECDKEFHVSPFLGMDQRYRWSLNPPGERLRVGIANFEGETPVFDVALGLERRPLSGSELAGALLRQPFMTGQVIAGIYWQALRLHRKRAPFHPHPGSSPVGEEPHRA